MLRAAAICLAILLVLPAPAAAEVIRDGGGKYVDPKKDYQVVNGGEGQRFVWLESDSDQLQLECQSGRAITLGRVASGAIVHVGCRESDDDSQPAA